jgi:hypothetical protein
LTRTNSDPNLRLVIARLPRIVSSFTAALLIGSVLLGHRAMMTCMDDMQGMDHGASHHSAPHHAVGQDCCGVCACSIATSVPTAAVLALRTAPERVHATVDRDRFMPVVPAPHARPFSIGPPLHLA